MCPHSDDLDGLDIIENLIDKAMLYVDSPGIGTRKVSDEFFKRRRILVRVFSDDIQQTGS
jgi:hypothetical protein